MEEIEELRAKVIASMSAPANPSSKLSKTPLKTKEDGELSSSEDDDVPTSSAAQSTSTTMPPVEPNGALVNKPTQSSKMGKCVSVNSPAGSGDTQPKTSVKQNYNKHFEMNSVPSKSANRYTPGWYVPSAANNNLVISFSDDDSGSDSEEYKPERTLEKKANTLGVDRYKRPPASSQLKSEYLRQTANKQMKMLPKKVSQSRTFISSMTKIHGGNSRGSGTSLADQVSHRRSFDSINKTSARHERGSSQGANLNNNELESLRQQIAIRENQLEHQRKSVQQSKETNSGSYLNYNGTMLNKNAAWKSRSTSVNAVHLAPDEQDKKRLKLDVPYHSKLNLDGQQQMLRPATRSTSKLKMPLVDNSGIKDRNLVACIQCTEEIPEGTTDPSTDKQQGKVYKQVPVSPENLLTGVKDGESSLSFLETISSTAPNFELPNRGSSRLVPITSRADDGAACQLKMPSPKYSNAERLKHPSTLGGTQSSTSFPNKATCQHNLMRSSDYNDIPGDRILKPSSDNIFDKCSIDIPESKLGTTDTSPMNTSLLNYSGQLNLLGHNSMDMQSLVKMEELQDKELEEAQEHRRRCELEERNALKAYRESQRALVEANARCTYFYRRRELFSAQFRAFIMENSSSLWSSRWDKHAGSGLDSLNNVPEANVNLLPTLSHRIQAELEVLNQLGDSNIQCTDDALLHTSNQHMSGHNLVSEPCSEPDASTSELLHHKDNSAVNGVCTPSNHPHMSAEEDEETFPFDQKAVQSRLVCENEENFGKRVMDINEEPERKSFIDGGQDYTLLEASLRSELFARLGTKTLSKNSGLHFSGECNVDKGVESVVESKKSHISMRNQLFEEAGQKQISDIEGTDRLGRSVCQSLQIHKQCHGNKCSFDYGSCKTADPEESSSSLIEACRSTASVSSFPSSFLRIAFSHVKDILPTSFRGFQTITQQKCIYDVSHEEDSGLSCYEFLLGFSSARLAEDSARVTDMGEMGSYTCDLSIDPFWPICMFELRGKCNDEECSWQHVKDYSGRNIKQRDDSASTDCEVVPLLHLGKFTRELKLSLHLHRHILSAPPTYVVGSDLLKADLHTSGSVLVRSICQYWQKGFSTSLALPFSAQRNLLSDVPFLHGGIDGHIEGQGSWNRKSLYFQSQDGAMTQLRQGLTDPEQALDLALVLFNGEVNKLEGKKKALSVLSRALEADPTSVILWIFYLHIYYKNEKAIGKDDMFCLAIHNNEGSYELWLMYINSRVQLDDRLVAYDTALSALCRHASHPDRDMVHASACILDLFIQMMDCLCMSGDVGKAIQRIYGLFPTATDVADVSSVLLSEILACLTVSDKCVFWVCCVYLVMYRKLPDAVIQQFEFEKELPFAIEWPSVQLTADEKHQAVELTEMGVDSVALGNNGGSHERETASRLAHLLAVSHVRCVAVLEGLECSKKLLDKYIKLYPTCLELVLTSARLHKNCFGELDFDGFEDALRNWPREAPGVQCIWNQYAQYALESGRIDFAKELMVRWFHSVWKVHFPQNGKLDVREDDVLYDSSESPSSPRPDASFVSNQKDELFGLLNLSLYRLLQKDEIEARLAIDRALKIAAPEDFKHCVREHAVFVLSVRSEPMDDAPASGILSLLNGYLVDARCSPVSEPLCRKFCQNIKKPRTRQLFNNILGPISCDWSLVNSVLEAWYGPSILPESFDRLKDLVDLVEALMEVFPANYRLALSVCEFVTRDSNSSGVASASVLFWASSLLVNSVYQAVPAAPEHTWVEVAGILGNLVEMQGISESFHQQALSVHPFSIKLWKSYFNISKMTGNESAVVAAARERGIKLD